MPEAKIASMTSPEQGAPQESSNTLLRPPGRLNESRTKGALRTQP